MSKNDSLYGDNEKFVVGQLLARYRNFIGDSTKTKDLSLKQILQEAVNSPVQVPDGEGGNHTFHVKELLAMRAIQMAMLGHTGMWNKIYDELEHNGVQQHKLDVDGNIKLSAGLEYVLKNAGVLPDDSKNMKTIDAEFTEMSEEEFFEV